MSHDDVRGSVLGIEPTSFAESPALASVALKAPLQYRGAAAVAGTVWSLEKGSTNIVIRHGRNGDVLNRIDLVDEGATLACVGSHVWVATASNRVYVFSHDGSMLGAVQSQSVPSIVQFFSGSGILLSHGGGKDFVSWNTFSFSVDRTFYGKLPGEAVNHLSVVPGTKVFSAATNMSLRLWHADGTLLAETNEGALCTAAYSPTSSKSGATPDAPPSIGKSSVRIWAAQKDWISVFSLDDVSRSGYFTRDATLQVAGITDLLLLAIDRMASFDSNGTATIWDSAKNTPLKAFKTSMPSVNIPGVAASSAFSTLSVQTRNVVVWTCSGIGATIWADEAPLHTNSVADLPSEVLLADEVAYLRRKASLLESLSTAFRQRVGIAIKEHETQTPDQVVGAFSDADAKYTEGMTAALESDIEPLPNVDSSNAFAADHARFTEYWKHKFHDLQREFAQLSREHDDTLGLLHQQSGNGGSGGKTDIQRALHICTLIKDKADDKERMRQLQADVDKLRARLQMYSNPLGGNEPVTRVCDLTEQNDALREEVHQLRTQHEADANQLAQLSAQAKQNPVLKQRLAKLRQELDTLTMNNSESSAASQANVDALAATVAVLKEDVRAKDDIIAQQERERVECAMDLARANSMIDALRSSASAASREVQNRDSADKQDKEKLRDEVKVLCQTLDERDKKILELTDILMETSAEARSVKAEFEHARAALEAKSTELEGVQKRAKHLEEILGDRQQFATAVGELQNRMELSVEELRSSFTPLQFQSEIQSLEQRVGGLFALENQLRQKDDIIALRDDEIQRLKHHAATVDKQIQNISAVFLQFPKNVNEVERLMVENDEFRRRIGFDAELQEIVQIRLLELQVKRNANSDSPRKEGEGGKSLKQLQALSAAGASPSKS